MTFSDLAYATRTLADAQVALTTTPDEEIAARQEHVERAKRQEAKLKVLFEAGRRGGEAPVYYSAKRERDSAEISLLKARLKAKQ